MASAGWKRGCEHFSCRCSQHVTHCRKEICCTCLSKRSIPAIPLWNSNHPTYKKLEVPESRITFRHLCIKWLHHAHPFVAAAEKDCVIQRSRGFGHGVVSKELLQYSDCALSCAMRLLQTNDSIVEIELLATVSWMCGCQPLSCRCSQNVIHCRKAIYATGLSKESIPAIPFWNSKHPLPTQVPESGSTLHQLCMMVASCLQKIELWYSRFGQQDSWLFCTYVYDICDCWKPMKNCRSLSELEAGLPAFELPMFAKCDALPKGDLLESILALPFWNSKHSLPTRSLSFLRVAYVPPSLH